MIRPIHHRSELLALAARLAPTRACGRALAEGKTTILGGFTPAGDFPQWIIRVEGPHQEWYLAIITNERDRRYQSRYYDADDVPWGSWIGSPKGNDPLHDGDEPRQTHMRKVLHATAKPTT